MTAKQQFVTHLDADQLNAFVEGALSAHERAHCLEHLAECARCREIVFLADAAVPEKVVPAPVRRVGFGWWPTLSLGSAAVAAVVVMGVVMYRSHQVSEMPTTQVAVEHPVPPPAAATPAPADRAVAAKPKAPPAARPSSAQKLTPKPESFDALGSQRLRNVPLANGAGIPAQPQAAAVEPQPVVTINTTDAAVSAAVPQLAPAPIDDLKNPTAESKKKNYTAIVNAAAAAKAQHLDGSAQVSGVITDPSGAVIPDAAVALYRAAGTAHWETTTDGSGHFTIAKLQPGKYRLEVTSPGFMTQTREVELGANQLAQLDSKLDAGSASEAVTVDVTSANLSAETEPVSSELELKAPIQTSVTVGEQTLVLDAAGRIFLRKKAGKHWKLVHGPWKNADITGFSLTADQQFEVATAEGRWRSSDGEHWHSVSQP